MVTLALTPIPGHSVFLLLVQLALLLLVARAGATLARVFGLPAVVGELAAGIVLGPSVFGHYIPSTFAMIFPHESSQFQLLETVGLLGMVLLLLLTGLETDLKLLRNLGRAALVASALGMLVPFATGFGLGLWMPDTFLAQPERRTLFAAFLATAMAISAMPVIAKILMDLDLTKRNIGLVILSAGVVDDTAGWLILSVIAGAATRGGQIELSGLGRTVISMTGFLVIMAFVFYPLMRAALRLLATRFRSSDTDLVLIVATTMLCAAATEKIGVHAVFGAFIAGTAFRQIPHLNHDSIHKLESFVFSILAPVFFGTVGLKVDLWTLGGGGGWMLGIVLAIACIGKLLGCTVGGLWGGLSFWEAVSIAVAMNARGAMELVVATIGLSLGILNQQMFSIIVVVAVVTSFMAPIALRLTMRLVNMTREEQQRILEEESRGAFDPAHLRVLVPTAGGPHALEAVRVALGLTARSENPVEVIYVDQVSTAFERFLRLLGPSKAGRGLEEHMNEVKALPTAEKPPVIRRVTGQSASRGIVEEASRGVDVVMIGASPGGIGSRILEEVVEEAPCHVAIVKAATARHARYERLFVPIDGSTVSRLAAEFALRFAEATEADLTLAFVAERRAAPVDPEQNPDDLPERGRPSLADGSTLSWRPPASDPPPADRLSRVSELPSDSLEYLTRISPAFRVSAVKPNIVHLDYDPSHSATATAIVAGRYDIVVLGAENRAVRKRLFFGYENQRIIDLQSVTTLILVPNFARIH